jgi:hypothetical protein
MNRLRFALFSILACLGICDMHKSLSSCPKQKTDTKKSRQARAIAIPIVFYEPTICLVPAPPDVKRATTAQAESDST